MRRRTKTAAHFYVDTQSGGFWAHRDFPSAHSLTGRGGVVMLNAALLLLCQSMFWSLHLAGGSGSFPRPLTAEEERQYLELCAKGDLDARNVLVERNLRLVAHIIKKM